MAKAKRRRRPSPALAERSWFPEPLFREGFGDVRSWPYPACGRRDVAPVMFQSRARGAR